MGKYAFSIFTIAILMVFLTAQAQDTLTKKVSGPFAKSKLITPYNLLRIFPSHIAMNIII